MLLEQQEPIQPVEKNQRYCVDCRFYDKSAVVQQGRGAMVEVCNHPNLRNPVDGNPIPCGVLRQSPMCGWDAIQFQPKPKLTLIQGGKDA